MRRSDNEEKKGGAKRPLLRETALACALLLLHCCGCVGWWRACHRAKKQKNTCHTRAHCCCGVGDKAPAMHAAIAESGLLKCREAGSKTCPQVFFLEYPIHSIVPHRIIIKIKFIKPNNSDSACTGLEKQYSPKQN